MYIEQTWHAIEVVWDREEVLRTVPLDSLVRVRIPFDERGNPLQPLVVGEPHRALLENVERVLRDVTLPEPSSEVRTCLANRALIANFGLTVQ
jgi:hypothetical protein